jgi:hypothetical protein
MLKENGPQEEGIIARLWEKLPRSRVSPNKPDQAVNYVAQERYSFFIINALIFHHSLFVWLALTSLRASLATPFFQGILIFPRENKLISLGKMEIPWKNRVVKLALRVHVVYWVLSDPFPACIGKRCFNKMESITTYALSGTFQIHLISVKRTAMIKPSEGFASDASSPYSDCVWKESC